MRERCLTASRQGSSSSSSWKRGVAMISAASGRSLGLHDNMLRTMLSYRRSKHGVQSEYSQCTATASLLLMLALCRLTRGFALRIYSSSLCSVINTHTHAHASLEGVQHKNIQSQSHTVCKHNRKRTHYVSCCPDRTRGFPVLQNHRLCYGIMLISLQSEQVNRVTKQQM